MPNSSKKRRSPSADSDLEARGPAKRVKQGEAGSTKASAATSSGMARDDDGNEYWELSGMKRVMISEFKGKTLVGIREFYTKDGKSLPGKKGISLPVETFGRIVALLPQIEAVLATREEHLPRPVYDAIPVVQANMGEEGQPKESKQNFEETSEDGE